MSRKSDFHLPFQSVKVADVLTHLTELQDGSKYAIDDNGREIIETTPRGEKIRWAISALDEYNRNKFSYHTHVFLRGEDIED